MSRKSSIQFGAAGALRFGLISSPAGTLLAIRPETHAATEVLGTLLAAINDATPEGKILLASAKQILANLGKKTADAIPVEDAANTAKIFAASALNGDGVIPPEATEDAATQSLIKEIIATIGGTPDLAGSTGVTVLWRCVRAACGSSDIEQIGALQRNRTAHHVRHGPVGKGHGRPQGGAGAGIGRAAGHAAGRPGSGRGVQRDARPPPAAARRRLERLCVSPSHRQGFHTV